jgi:hypothetical protein
MTSISPPIFAARKMAQLVKTRDPCLIQFLQHERGRKWTYHDWPYIMPHADCLAEEGFYYFGQGDAVQCVYCTSILTTWAATDEPHQEHKRISPTCPAVLGLPVTNFPTPTRGARKPCCMQRGPLKRSRIGGAYIATIHKRNLVDYVLRLFALITTLGLLQGTNGQTTTPSMSGVSTAATTTQTGVPLQVTPSKSGNTASTASIPGLRQRHSHGTTIGTQESSFHTWNGLVGVKLQEGLIPVGYSRSSWELDLSDCLSAQSTLSEALIGAQREDMPARKIENDGRLKAAASLLQLSTIGNVLTSLSLDSASVTEACPTASAYVMTQQQCQVLHKEAVAAQYALSAASLIVDPSTKVLAFSDSVATAASVAQRLHHVGQDLRSTIAELQRGNIPAKFNNLVDEACPMLTRDCPVGTQPAVLPSLAPYAIVHRVTQKNGNRLKIDISVPCLAFSSLVAKYAVEATPFTDGDDTVAAVLPQRYTVWAARSHDGTSGTIILEKGVECAEVYSTPLPLCSLSMESSGYPHQPLTGTSNLAILDAPVQPVIFNNQALRWSANDVLVTNQREVWANKVCGLGPPQPVTIQSGRHREHLKPGCQLRTGIEAGPTGLQYRDAWWLPPVPKTWLIEQLPELLSFATGKLTKTAAREGLTTIMTLAVPVAAAGSVLVGCLAACCYRKNDGVLSKRRERQDRRVYLRTASA